MVLRAKTKNLFSGKELTLRQQMNSQKNIEEMNMCVGGGENSTLILSKATGV